jgi:hypothetical protein
VKKNRFIEEQIVFAPRWPDTYCCPGDAIRVGRQIILEGEAFRGLEPF